MKKALFILLILSSFFGYSQSYIYLNNGGIRIETAMDTFSINPVQFDWRKSGKNYIVRDNIQKQDINLGNYTQIYNESETIGSDETVKNYLNKLVNSIPQQNIDSTSNAFLYVSYEHHEIHEGDHFFFDGYSGTLGGNDELSFVITTPAGEKRSHFLFSIESITGARIEIYEDCTTVSGGTTITSINNNRNSSNVSILTIKYNPTFVVAGTKISSSSAGGLRVAGILNRSREIILKQNSIYFFRITSLAASNVITYTAQWYEHSTGE